MPIEFPPQDRGPAFAPDNDEQAFAPAFDVTNLGMIGSEFSRDSLNPGQFLDGQTSRGVNLRNMAYQYEAIDFGVLPNPVPAPLSNDGLFVLQFDSAAANWEIKGVTRNSTGAVLGSCTIDIFETGSDLVKASTVSAADGSFTISNPGTGPFYLVAYKAGSPDVAGTTVNTVMPTAFVYPPNSSGAFTAFFSFAYIQSFQLGSVNQVINPARIYGTAGETFYVMRIKGTRAVMHLWSDFGDDGTLCSVSVDGGAFANVVASPGDAHTLFTGLSDSSHIVIVKPGAAYGTAPYILSNGPVVEVTGSDPTINPPVVWIDPIYTPNVAGAALKVANYTNYQPPFLPGMVSTVQSKCSLAFTSATTYLDIFSGARFVYVSIDGGAPTRYDQGGSTGAFLPRYLRINSSGSHRFNVWVDNGLSVGNYNWLYVGVDSAPVPTGAGRLEQFGDSITYGQGASDVGQVDVYRIAAQYGYAGQAFGISGQNLAQLASNVGALLGAKTSDPANDVAIIAIGRNDTGTWDSTSISNYTAVITAMLPYYKKILCRGVIREGSTIWSTFNNGLSALVTSLANPKVVYINADSWTGVTTVDGIHPDDAGYTTIAGYASTAYASYL